MSSDLEGRNGRWWGASQFLGTPGGTVAQQVEQSSKRLRWWFCFPNGRAVPKARCLEWGATIEAKDVLYEITNPYDGNPFYSVPLLPSYYIDVPTGETPRKTFVPDLRNSFQAQSQIDFVHMAESGGVRIGVNSAGQVWTWGNLYQSRFPPAYNVLGFGPITTDRIAAAGYFRSRWYANNGSSFSPAVVVGENFEMADKRFVKCGIAADCTSALDSDGVLWFCGSNALDNFGDGSSHEAGRSYFKPLEGWTWSDYAHGEIVLAIDEEGELYEWGFGLDEEHGTEPRKMYGFVDTVTIEDDGSARYREPPDVIVSEPEDPDGEKAEFVALLHVPYPDPNDRGDLLYPLRDKIARIVCVNGGRGYTEPPTITIDDTHRYRTAGDPPEVPADPDPIVDPTISCTIWTGTWKKCASSPWSRQRAAIDNNDRVYVWGGYDPYPLNTPLTFLEKNETEGHNAVPQSRRNPTRSIVDSHIEYEFTDVAVMDTGGAAIGGSRLWTWGPRGYSGMPEDFTTNQLDPDNENARGYHSSDHRTLRMVDSINIQNCTDLSCGKNHGAVLVVPPGDNAPFGTRPVTWGLARLALAHPLRDTAEVDGPTRTVFSDANAYTGPSGEEPNPAYDPSSHMAEFVNGRFRMFNIFCGEGCTFGIQAVQLDERGNPISDYTLYDYDLDAYRTGLDA